MTELNNRYIRGMHNLSNASKCPLKPDSVVTIGSYDGVHLGHQAIMRQVVDKAKEEDLRSIVVVFEPHPNEFFSAEKAPARLMTFREKVLAIYSTGVDLVSCMRFNESLASLSPEAFVRQILVDGLKVKHLIVGDDFRFGHERHGDYQYLDVAGKEFGFSVTDTRTFAVDGERVSSTRIRRELEAANFSKVEQLLGKPYCISGKIAFGQQLARQWGVPTANVHLRRYRSPLQGVFAVKAHLCDGRAILGVANVGVRPTIGTKIKPILEVHLLDFDENLYGKRTNIEFLHKLREEQKFASFDELKQQIYGDIEHARAYFTEQKIEAWVDPSARYTN